MGRGVIVALASRMMWASTRTQGPNQAEKAENLLDGKTIPGHPVLRMPVQMPARLNPEKSMEEPAVAQVDFGSLIKEVDGASARDLTCQGYLAALARTEQRNDWTLAPRMVLENRNGNVRFIRTQSLERDVRRSLRKHVHAGSRITDHRDHSFRRHPTGTGLRHEATLIRTRDLGVPPPAPRLEPSHVQTSM